ncbi:MULTISPECIES: hypothetical protein [unclassified Mesorhizobium]|nr:MULTISPECIES: hypothetical protein [unclassified Mesorhizobium]
MISAIRKFGAFAAHGEECSGAVETAAYLPLYGRSCMKTDMNTRASSVASRPTGFAGETVRALASTLLLLGLIGDRRVR